MLGESARLPGSAARTGTEWEDGGAMSPHAPQPVFRTARAVVFATVCTSFAVTGHVLAGGAVPFWSAAAGFAAVLGVTCMLAGHERSLATILGGLLGGQVADRKSTRLNSSH